MILLFKAAPKLTADAAGLPVGDVITASIPLVITMGVVTTVICIFLFKTGYETWAFLSQERTMKYVMQDQSNE